MRLIMPIRYIRAKLHDPAGFEHLFVDAYTNYKKETSGSHEFGTPI